MGLAISDELTGPYEKYDANPLFKGHAFTVTKYDTGMIALPGGNHKRLLWSADGIHFVDGPMIRHKSTGVCNPADFIDTRASLVDWFIDVIPIRPRKLYRVNLINNSE